MVTGVVEKLELSTVFVKVRGSGTGVGVRNPAVGMDRRGRSKSQHHI